jgi:uncharacterized protein (DUF1697 family)
MATTRATRRYAAFLRGVMPTNAKMGDLARAFEAAGFEDVRTVLSSGNVVFSATAAPAAALERKAEAAMQDVLGKVFPALVRSVDALGELLASDPYAGARLAPGSRRVVTFLRREPDVPPGLPVELGGARILAIAGAEVFSAYVPGARGPAFMTLIEKTLGRDVTTRTWETVGKVASAGGAARAEAITPRRRASARRR